MCGSNRNGCTEINHSKLVLYSALLAFAINWALKLDGLITASFWWVFLPLFVWKGLLFCGCLVGSLVWFLSPQLREGRTEFHAMWLCCSLHVQLVLFEVLCCAKLEMGGGMEHLSWIIVFTPLLFSTPFAAMCFLWLYRNDRSFILELIHGGSTLFYVFTALKLDHTINWSWGLIFLPVWVLMCVVCFVVVYCSCWSIFMLRQMGQDVSNEQRRYYIRFICTGIALLLPLLTFFVLLVSKLESIWETMDGVSKGAEVESKDMMPPESLKMKVGGPKNNHAANPSADFEMPWLVTMIPLYATLVALISTTLGARGGNRWLFGMRTDLCTFALNVFPFLKEYGNISVKLSATSDASFNNSSSWTAMSPVLLNLRLAVDPSSNERDVNNEDTAVVTSAAATEQATSNRYRIDDRVINRTTSESFIHDECAVEFVGLPGKDPLHTYSQIIITNDVAGYHRSNPGSQNVLVLPCEPARAETRRPASSTSRNSCAIEGLLEQTPTSTNNMATLHIPCQMPTTSQSSNSCHQTLVTEIGHSPLDSNANSLEQTQRQSRDQTDVSKNNGHEQSTSLPNPSSSSQNPFARFAHFRKIKSGISFGSSNGTTSASHAQSSTCDVDLANDPNNLASSSSFSIQNESYGNEFNQIAIYCPD